jgi:hypothetical protein
MKAKPARSIVSLVVIACFSLIGISCHKQATEKTEAEQPSSQSTPAKPAPSPLTGFAADLQFIKNGQYSYIYVFSRKDGKPLDSEDGQFLRTNAPQMVDWVKTDEGKKVIGGTNFNLAEGNLGLLQKRFVVEDYSGK